MWLSFGDTITGEWLGVSIVWTPNGLPPRLAVMAAIQTAHNIGCNPGGEVMTTPAREDFPDPPAGASYRLITSRDEANAIDEAWSQLALDAGLKPEMT